MTGSDGHESEGAQSTRRWEPAATLTRHARVWPWVFPIIALATLVFRRPDVLLHPGFVAEDGQVLYVGTYFEDVLSQITRPYNGYLLVLHRILAWTGRAAPVEWAPAALALAAMVVVVAAATYVGIRGTNLKHRWVLAGFMIVVPAAGESIGVLSTVQFQFAIAMLVGLLAPKLASRTYAAVEAGAMFIAGLSGPFSDSPRAGRHHA